MRSRNDGPASPQAEATIDIPPAGTLVTAVPLGLVESKANNLLEYPDPAIPDMDGAPEAVTGPLKIVTVDARLMAVHLVYTRYEVDGWDVDEKTIRPL